MPARAKSPRVVATRTPSTNASEFFSARSDVTKMIADMICGPAIIVMASGRISVFTLPSRFSLGDGLERLLHRAVLLPPTSHPAVLDQHRVGLRDPAISIPLPCPWRAALQGTTTQSPQSMKSSNVDRGAEPVGPRVGQMHDELAQRGQAGVRLRVGLVVGGTPTRPTGRRRRTPRRSRRGRTPRSSPARGPRCHPARAYSPPIATHRYATRLRWTGSTGLGWDHYERTHFGDRSAGGAGGARDDRRVEGRPERPQPRASCS